MLILNLECPMDATLKAADIAFKNNIPVILNPAPARELDVEFLKKCDCITPNRSEAAELFGIDADAPLVEIAKTIIDAKINRAVITLGGDGALLIDGGEAWKFDSIRVKAVDTTGAGDTFSAALGRAILRGDGMIKAVEYAMNAAAKSVTKPHVMDGLPTEDELYKSYVEIIPEKIL
jgi:ribokinase